MSGCPTHGPLVGGYALGALEPEEMEEMRRHVAVCPHCGPEADRLKALPGLLDRSCRPTCHPQRRRPRWRRRCSIDSPASGGRRARAGRRSAVPTAPRAVPRFSVDATGSSPAGRSWSGWRALSQSWWRSRWYSRAGTTRAGTPAYASVSLEARAGGSASATAWLDQVPAGTRIRLESSGLPAGSEYEVWCIRSDGRWVERRDVLGGSRRPRRR